MFCQPGYQFFMQVLDNSPLNYLEIGVFNGDSVAGLARAHTGKIIYGIDPFIEDGCTTDHTKVEENQPMETQRDNTYRHIEGLDNVVLFETLSSEFADMLTDEMVADMNVGWVLIDGSHHYKDVIVDVHLAMRLIGEKTGGVVFDDLNLEGVAQAHQEFLQLYKNRITGVVDLYDFHPGHILAYKIN